MTDLAARLAADRLEVFGGFHPGPQDDLPDGTGTLLLLGPREPRFWPHVTAAPEFADGRPDPLDRWSARVITAIAEDTDAKPLFPFGGPPYHPFVAWALRSGRAWQSPVGLLVHDRAGLMVSYRGALALPERLNLPPAPPCPCETCHDQPCRAACPAAALGPAGYDLDACRRFLDTGAGRECMEAGCMVRRICPVSRGYGRRTAQSAFHMRAFHP
ncbi:ferredoxin [Psychromarinibacter sp. C21-152]|uniref:Ferredoxin n=1 Tax=Psychromarinibacter sediminicola TaxID=3033385 RepID=A0AAE3NX57_9RHOB|nr:ferredoxin [Psychromarinibacter sediminicola]MDF0602580.1 ferredoxin [Psychromarinibacter sediminicola]